MKIKLLLLFIVLFSFQTNAQTVTALQQQNTRATGYAIVAARNPGKSFSVYLVKWDGLNTLDYNATTQINSAWHAQAVVKGNYFNQSFDGTDFTNYSSVIVSQAEFDIYKSNGSDWWIVCSTLPAFSNSGLTIADNGNVGIGTIAPFTRLTLASGYGGASGIGIDFTVGVASSRRWYLSNDNQVYGDFVINTEATQGNATQTLNRFYINATGNVGIGTTNPAAKLDVNGAIYSNTNILSDSFGGFSGGDTELTTNTGGVANLKFKTQMTERMRINASGNVGIGTTLPDEKLTVNGRIHATEVKVTATVPADYVFQKYYTGKSELKSDYTMPTLTEIEKYTKANNHLPEVPSAQEIEKNGLQLGEMNMILLQKVEELTLYIIEQNKRIEILEKKIK